MRIVKSFLWLLCVAVVLFVSKAGAADDNQAWTAVAANGPLEESSNFLLWFDGHARFQDDASELGTTIIRPGIGWKVNDKLKLWLGYAWITGRRDGPDVKEERIWQQAAYPVVQIFGGRLSGRTRLEQRTRDGANDTGWRLRQAWRWSRPMEGTELSFVVANETFVGLNDADWGQRDGYDQNRAFLGLGWQATPKMRVDTGYLNNHIDGGSAGDRTNHIFAVALSIAL